jgi:DNA recombination protein RmuC
LDAALIYVVVFAAGVGLGALLAWTLARGRAAALQARLDAALQAQDSQQASFKALAADVLQANSRQFFDQARQLMESLTKQAEGTLQQRQQAIEHLVQPLQQSLGSLQREVSTLEGRRQEAFTNLERELGRLQQETGNLTTALRRPQGRGRWGEITLRRVVEAAGMSKHCDFTEQSYLQGEDGRYRPDMLIHLPGERRIVVDSKTPLDAYLEAVEAVEEGRRNDALRRHAAQVRQQMQQLSSKDYWSRLDSSPEFVVLFLPGESFFAAALEQDRTLIEDGIAQRVILATPTTLIALLKSVAYAWRQEQLAENSRQISELGKEMYDRVATLTEHLRDMGAALNRAVASYNKAVGSFESRAIVTARKFKDLGATVADDIPPLDKVDETPRTLDVGQPALDPSWKEK